MDEHEARSCTHETLQAGKDRGLACRSAGDGRKTLRQTRRGSLESGDILVTDHGLNRADRMMICE